MFLLMGIIPLGLVPLMIIPKIRSTPPSVSANRLIFILGFSIGIGTVNYLWFFGKAFKGSFILPFVFGIVFLLISILGKKNKYKKL